MQIRWLGHSCFLLETEKEAWLTDPFAPSVGYPIPDVTPTVVSMSHEHYDHTDESWLPAEVPKIREGVWRGDGLKLSSVATFHDQSCGQERGSNYIFIGETSALRIAHLGDLGHIPTQQQREQIGRIDLLLMPVGGTYTIGAEQAWQVVELLSPAVVIPMHYQTEHLTFPLAGVEEFLQAAPLGFQIEEKKIWKVEENLAGGRIVVLKYI